ncbi:phosphoribosyl-ATP diphosphatase [Candidatus Magnetominusculus xianensis]|uniref:Phosphoribosyl-ATP pyrophosphatase n=1 Tax=Candidatus Magnetominusculus xianensis TaxID=1748249 RepID=A0ABR5SIE6_9BACT|nr:phosphoribosyl-ATP diphosphatase [Candidatus Magnetominusculus xianensis]KWT84408.1 phosphoribosyl-ATP pyrophosphatase [Candidatus Magnetominusculus xianensis]MBF0404242.1 phosphoribosyl-ATP diphosphatase [Nitrospirota bacterium]
MSTGKNTTESNTDNSEGNTIEALYRLILQRKETPQEHSYTCSLFSRGKDEILKKFGEEAVEVIIAAKGQGRQRLIEELSDLCYHALVLMADEGVSPEDISLELNKRSKGRDNPP